MLLDPYTVSKHILSWVEEDSPYGDLTTYILINDNVTATAQVVVKSRAIVACTRLIAEALRLLGFNVKSFAEDGSWIRPGNVILELSGDARRILLFERTLLNILIYTFSVATTTRYMVDKARRYGVRVAATRKTPPGLRYYAKCAVMQGGGDTHRFSLSDAIIIKDNHIVFFSSISDAIKRARERASFVHKIEVEVSNPLNAIKAAEAGADVVMLDNMSPTDIRKTIKELERRGLRDKVVVEASGGITLENVEDYASTGVDVVSTSIITMNPVRVDLSLRIK